jgi:membrane protein DedA with SNARE-associated domain
VLEHFLQIATPWLEQYGYVALFMALFMEGVGIPAPGLTFMLASVLLASRGEMVMIGVLGAAFAGFVSGCQLAFLVGRNGGRRLLLRTGVLNRQRQRRLHRLFGRWGAPFLVAAPFFEGTRQYSSMAAGTAAMDWRRFTLFNVAGISAWIGIWCTATDMLGHHLEPVLKLVHGSAVWLLGAVLTLIIALLIYLFIHRRPESP